MPLFSPERSGFNQAKRQARGYQKSSHKITSHAVLPEDSDEANFTSTRMQRPRAPTSSFRTIDEPDAGINYEAIMLALWRRRAPW
jgi:hypothetical protein